MSQALRQSELFAAQDWQVLYRAFTQINFNASDPPSINRALREYIRTNYPEDYNDWIESSEFVAIIDLLSWLAGNLAFKTDINARENFLETAEARESILRLARFLSYNPRRNQCSRGVLKIVEIETDDDVYDSYGNNLANRPIRWASVDDPDWEERFTAILDNALTGTNPVGVPLKSRMIAGTRTQLYALDTRWGDQAPLFRATTAGTPMDYEIVNADLDDEFGLYERAPDPNAAFHIAYRNDGRGDNSDRTGYFIAFKQGRLQRVDTVIEQPVENQTIAIDVPGVNQTDVWVQTVDSAGGINLQWRKVPALFSENITFTSIPAEERNIFSVITRADDQITVRFGDGRFSAAPVGNIRVWYRTSEGRFMQIRPQEIDRVRQQIVFINKRGVERRLFVTMSLTEPVTNGLPAETDEQIKERAPAIYATQNRMVSGEDYNTFPLQTNLATKLKAMVRVYSGQSRFVDLKDPTGNYQSTVVFSDDGILFKERADTFEDVPDSDNRTPEEIVGLFIAPMIRTDETTDYVRDLALREIREYRASVDPWMNWRVSTSQMYESTGWVTVQDNRILPGSMLLVENNGPAQWVPVIAIDGAINTAPASGQLGPISVAEPILDNAKVMAILPRYLNVLPDNIVAQVESRIRQKTSFALWYDLTPSNGEHWSVELPNDDPPEPPYSGSRIRIVRADYLGTLWCLRCAGLRHVFESDRRVRWYFDGQRAYDPKTGLTKTDHIRVLGVNPDITDIVYPDELPSGRPLDRDYDLKLRKTIVYPNGRPEPRRIGVGFNDRDLDGFPDDPDAFWRICSPFEHERTLFWRRQTDGTLIPFFRMHVVESDYELGSLTPQYGDGAYSRSTDRWFTYTDAWNDAPFRSYIKREGRGPNVAASWRTLSGGMIIPKGSKIDFRWEHVSPNDRRIDPAITNLIDVFVLTTEYDSLVRRWLEKGSPAGEEPEPPSELQLKTSLGDLEDSKMFSDQIVWRPARYRYLFGTGAQSSLRAQFKVIRLPGSTMSDGEIKTRVVRAIREYFNADMWDFGETFYFTELAAYVHQQLAGMIGSFVIVPTDPTGDFGDGFEVSCRSDEIFLPTTQVDDVIIIDHNTPDNLRMR